MKKVSFIKFLLVLFVLGCGGQQVKPVEPPYMPTYAYKAASAGGAPHDVTIAIINPVVKGRVRGLDGAQMLHALPTSFVDLVTAKGMKYRGPVESRDAMTFPDKKGSDLGLYAEVDVAAGWEATNVRQSVDRSAWSGSTQFNSTCDVVVSARGTVSFVVIEPLSNETLWRKSIQVQLDPVSLIGQDGPVCGGMFGAGMAHAPMGLPPGVPMPPGMAPIAATAAGTGEQSPPGEAGNAYRRLLEAVYQNVMKNFDTYMNVEEFEMLKKQSKELREKKVY